ncbi:hypothetical protein TYRP_012356 [Tyrophagus putrescentiae]|nr:hypothetical protein TYRP_012356 [Tyrophagus putrescentiae]
MKFFIIAALISLAVANPALLVGHGGLGGYGNGLLLDGGLGLAGHGAAPAGLGGHGFGHGGHFSPMPVQTIQLVPVPQPVPVAQPIPVDKPYAVPIDKPYTVPVDRPVPAPYVAKVIQPVVHKQTVVSKAILSHGVGHGLGGHY